MQILQKTKRLLLSTTLATLVLASCYKAGTPASDTTPVTYSIMVSASSTQLFANGNIQDSVMTFQVNDSDTLQMRFSVTQKTGDPSNYPIQFSIDSLPHGVSANPPSVSFKLSYDFTSTLRVVADTGLYRIVFNVKTPVGINKFPARLRIYPPIPAPDCAGCLAHNWKEQTCNGDTCRPTLSTIPGMPHWISIRNINCLGDSVVVNAYVLCNGAMMIPPQTSHGYTIYGTGPYVCGSYAGAFTFPDTIEHAGNTTACSFFLSTF